MIPLLLARDPSEPVKVTCLGAHCDDIEIGCGGTLLALREQFPHLEMRWLILSSDEVRAGEARASAARFGVEDVSKQVQVETFRDGYLPYEGAAVKQAIHDHRGTFEPDVVFTHYRDDRHQDHRMVSDVTWNAYRDHLVLEYEIPKWDGDVGVPNVFMPLSENQVETKLDILYDTYVSQHEKDWFQPNAFRGLMAVRGVEARAPSGYAEAFHARKLVLASTRS